jgi:O-antigen/teichoic acid export membrane protein
MSFRARGRSAVAQDDRPLVVPIAAAVGVLVAAEALYLGSLLWLPDPRLDWFLVVPLVLAVAALTGTVLVLLRRYRSWLLLAGAAGLLTVALLGMVALLAAFGAWGEMWSAALLTVAPLGCLVLALRSSVREWTDRGRTRRSAGGRRGTARAR